MTGELVLPKQNRLHTSSEIYTIRKEGNHLYNQFFTCFFVTDTTSKEPRFAFVVSSKVSKNATNRNRTKRLLRQAVHELLPHITKTASVVCVAKTDLSGVPLQTIKGEVERTLRKAEVLER